MSPAFSDMRQNGCHSYIASHVKLGHALFSALSASASQPYNARKVEIMP
jgi:hypothetical protein